MKPALLLGCVLALASAVAHARPSSSQAPRVDRLAAFEFAAGSAVLDVEHPDVYRTLDGIAAWAAAHPEGLLVVDGHADRAGASPEAARLSLSRARVVHAALVALGVEPHQVLLAAFGNTGPRVTAPGLVVVWGSRPVPSRPRVKTPVARRDRPGSVVAGR
ncbi:MAG: OmpA family protein [Myxococcota bacterium]|nr:OmpA family protein [Myxococcota bacterium]